MLMVSCRTFIRLATFPCNSPSRPTPRRIAGLFSSLGISQNLRKGLTVDFVPVVNCVLKAQDCRLDFGGHDSGLGHRQFVAPGIEDGVHAEVASRQRTSYAQ